MERSVRVIRVVKATNETITEEVAEWRGRVFSVRELKIKLAKPMSDDELRGLFSDGSPKLELYYEDGQVVNVRKVGTWGR